MWGDLFLNLCAFVTMAYLLSATYRSWPPEQAGPMLWLRAALLSSVGVILMLFPAQLAPGVVMDLRAVPLAFAALRYGAPMGLLIALPSAAYRVYLGGQGVPVGLSSMLLVILAASILRPYVNFANPNRPLLQRWYYAAPVLMPYGLSVVFLPGGVDLLLKSYLPLLAFNALGFLIGGSILTARLQMLQLTSRFQAQALLDPLTRLANRRQFDQDLVYLTHRDAVLMIDIDHFKRVNDTFGHPTGDRVLTQVAQTVASALRPGDTAYRFGGEEFAVILRNTQPPFLHAVAERLRSAATLTLDLRPTDDHSALHGTHQAAGTSSEAALPPAYPPERWPITVSIGGAHASTGPHSAVARADAAMYHAKRSGRNRSVIDADDPHPPGPSSETRAVT